jgi:hypothetical protein
MRRQGESKLSWNNSSKKESKNSAWLSVRIGVGFLGSLLLLTFLVNLSFVLHYKSNDKGDIFVGSSNAINDVRKSAKHGAKPATRRGAASDPLEDHEDEEQHEDPDEEIDEGDEVILEDDEEEETKFDGQSEAAPPPVSLEDGQAIILAIFEDAGVTLTNEMLASLPSWNDIVANIGEAPRIYGLDRCEGYRLRVPAVERNVGCCGMFNSGTNLVTRLLKENCKIPERIGHYGWNGTFERWGMGPADAHGMRWQVPWGKHTAAKYRDAHSTKKADNIDKDSLLPIITIRNPYVWMQSMCKNGYTAKWPHGNKCPHLVTNTQSMKPTNLTVKYGDFEDVFDSLAHLWNGWYRQYWKDAEYPFLMVRFEDLIFHARNVTTQICHCAGGVIRTDRPFFHIVKSAKDGPGHGRKEERTDMVHAWIKYGNPLPIRGGFNKADFKASQKFLNRELMHIFGYKHPRSM